MTFTKKQLIVRAETVLSNARTAADFHDSKPYHLMDIHLAEIALASLEAEPVAYIIQDADARSRGEKGILRYFANISDEDINEYEITVTPLYTAPPAPVVNGEYSDAYQGAREDLAIWKRRALEAECHVRRLGQINDYLAKEAQGESRMGEPVIREPAPVSVPDALADDIDSDDHPLLWSYYNGRNACRAAMLQGAELVTTAYKLPAIGWLSADYQDDNRGLRGNAPLFVLGKKDPSTVWGLDYIPLTSNSPVIPDWQAKAEKMAELHGSSFVLFRNGESPQCADPTKVIISFTDEGLGHGSAAPQQEVK